MYLSQNHYLLDLHSISLRRFQDAAQTAGRASQLTFWSGTRNQTLLVIPFREHTLVQIHEDGVHGTELTIKHALHVTMGS